MEKIRTQRQDILAVMRQEQQRGGIAYHRVPMRLSDEQPEGDFFELPRQWVEPPKEK